MMETDVIFDEEADGLKVKEATLLAGLPGVGLVAKAAVARLLDRTKNFRICRLISPDFQSHGYVRGGKIVFSFADLYAALEPSPLLLLYGNAQPSTSYGQYEFCEKLMEVCRRSGCNFVVTLGGYSRENTGKERKLYCSSTDSEVLRKSTSKIDGSIFSGQIVGAAGLLLTAAARRRIDNLSILVETFGETPDFRGASKALEAVTRLLDLDFDIGDAEDVSTSYTSVLAKHELHSARSA